MDGRETKSPLHYWIGNVIWINKLDEGPAHGRLLDVKEDYVVIENNEGEHIYYKSEQVRSITINVKDTPHPNQKQRGTHTPYINEPKFKELIKRLAHRYVRINCGEEDIRGIMAGIRQDDMLLVHEHEVIILFANGIHHISCVNERADANENENEEKPEVADTAPAVVNVGDAVDTRAVEARSEVAPEETRMQEQEDYTEAQNYEIEEQIETQENKVEVQAYVQEDDITEARIVAQDEEADLAFEEDDDDMEMDQDSRIINVSLEIADEEVDEEVDGKREGDRGKEAKAAENPESENELYIAEFEPLTQPKTQMPSVLPFPRNATRSKKRTLPACTNVKRNKRKATKNRPSSVRIPPVRAPFVGTLSDEYGNRKKKKGSTNTNTKGSKKAKQSKNKAWLSGKVHGRVIS
ncbi:hypothetical protein [Aneurinibacillus danicus]|uniref:Spore coat protein B n=1 Tax=Aneurinibacillus danicus TaxID=267746 RepID=A0A511V177_9BACL|nr:hypothetical protein [Aneurinibacillus danicus]GEN32657.1 hypothetical protein ADA01nite_01170 [Aneurinibacillus danicus]